MMKIVNTIIFFILNAGIVACGVEKGESNDAVPENLMPSISIKKVVQEAKEQSTQTVEVAMDDADGHINSITWSLSNDESQPEIEFIEVSSNIYQFILPDIDEDSIFTLTVKVEDNRGGTATQSTQISVLKNTPPVVSGVLDSYTVAPLDQFTLNPTIDDIDGDSIQITVSLIDGPVTIDSNPSDLPIIVKTPADSGANQISTIELVVSDGLDHYTKSFQVITPTSAVKVISFNGEPSEDDDMPLTPTSDIQVTAPFVDKLGVFTATEDAVVIELTSDTSAQLTDLQIQLFNDDRAVVLTDHFSYDVNEGKLQLIEEKKTSFLNYLSDNVNELSITAYDTLNAQFAVTVSFRYGYASISGFLSDEEGLAYSGLQGEELSLHSTLTGLTYVTKIGKNGTYAFDGLPSDTYNISLLTANLEVASASILVTRNSSSYNVYPLVIALKEQNTSEKKATIFSNNTYSSDSAYSPDLKRQMAHLENIDRVNTNSNNILWSTNTITPIMTISSTASSQGLAVISNDTILVPEGLATISVRTTVYSPEYPSFTTINSVFNDSWQYTYSIGGNIKTQQGNVNTSHSSTDTITNTETFDVTALSGQPIYLFVRATNIGDHRLSTSVTIDVFAEDEQLSVSSFDLQDGLGLANQIWHMGVGETSYKKWNAIVNYSPKDAKLNDAICEFSIGTTKYPISDLDIANKSDGEASLTMGFSNLSDIPITTSSHGNIECEFEAIMPDGSTINTSHATIMGLPGGKSSITPLTALNIDGRRFGGRDKGGDHWMIPALRNFIMQTEFVYNDASREHGGCFVKDSKYGEYNSIGIICDKNQRDHATHQDGKAIDVRYVIPFISSTNLLNHIENAQNNQSSQDIVVQWVSTARTNLTNVSNRNDVAKIIISMEKWLYDIIVKGTDSNGNTVGTLSNWNNMSPKIGRAEGHTQHFHIQLK